MNSAVDVHYEALEAKRQASEQWQGRRRQLNADLREVLSERAGQRIFKHILGLFKEQTGNLSPQELIYQQGQRDLMRQISDLLSVEQRRAIEDLSWTK